MFLFIFSFYCLICSSLVTATLGFNFRGSVDRFYDGTNASCPTTRTGGVDVVIGSYVFDAGVIKAADYTCALSFVYHRKRACANSTTRGARTTLVQWGAWTDLFNCEYVIRQLYEVDSTICCFVTFYVGVFFRYLFRFGSTIVYSWVGHRFLDSFFFFGSHST